MIGTTLPHVVQASPNFNDRRADISILLLHYTGMRDAAAACDWLCRVESEVSCHYLVDADGVITQMVGEDKRAWHAGLSSWAGLEDINSRSIGIEIHNPGHALGYPDFPARQMTGVAALSSDICKRNAILPRHVLAHSDVAPGRKIDPGEKFEWRALHAQGIGHWVSPEPLSGGTFIQLGDAGDSALALQSLLKFYGYGIDISGNFDDRTKLVVEAFQRHFRPARVDGVADVSTIATLHKLLRAL